MQYRTQLIVPPSSLDQPCEITPPPTSDELLNADRRIPDTDPWEARALLLTNWGSEQTNNLVVCNKQRDLRQQWIDEQKRVVEDYDETGRGTN